jgi:uncharacterized protein YfaS (alpha-2-macroglobulin family)
MKLKTPLRLAAVMLVAAIAYLVVDAAGPREAQWKKVNDAVNKGLPKTAIEHLQPIIDQAIRDKDYPEAIKAVARKVTLEGTIQGNKPEEKIIRMQAEIEKAPAEMKPVMETLLAHYYWHYFLQNRWRIMQRTTTAEAPGKDLQTWDLPRILAEVDKQFTKALAAEKVLKAIKISDYDALIDKGSLPDTYRPTLWDFLVHDAITFYTSAEQAGAKAQDEFEIEATSPIFAPADEFRKWNIAGNEEFRLVKAIKLYQQLLQFHESDTDRTAYLDADLLRLNLGYNKAVGEEKIATYKAVLKSFAEKNAKHELSSKALHYLAQVYYAEQDFVEARKLAMQGEKAYPKSSGGQLCFNLIQMIEAKSGVVSTERVWTSDRTPTIQVRYRNLTEVHYRIVKADWNELIKSSNNRPEYLNDVQRRALLAAKPDHEWSDKLPATEDFHEKTHTSNAPKTLKPGFYWVIASHDKGFGAADNLVTFCDFWVSDLSMITRNRYGEGSVEGFVLNAISGEPLAEADVQIWVRQRTNRFAAGDKVKTDKNGVFTFNTDANFGYLLQASHNGQMLVTNYDYHSGRYDNKPRPYNHTVFFTDRSLYRPGQIVSYKGICVKVDQNDDNYTTIANQDVVVIFSDPNNKEIARQNHKTNEYGSFSGSFTTPRDRLMGRMMIRTEGDPRGQTAFNVEEYKRPKFQVALDAPKTAAKLNAQVQLTGKATAYTGSAIGGAKVRYRVVRETRYPDWWGCCYWWRPTPQTPAQEIAHGFSMTEADGNFPVQFFAKPDLTVPEKDEPIFRYTVYADVTDTTGETRSSQRSVQVAYTALKATLAAEPWQTDKKDVDVNVATTTIDGEPQTAKVKLKVFALKQPDKVERAKLHNPHFLEPYPMIRRGGLIVPPKPDPSNVDSWELGAEVASREVTTDDKGKVLTSFKLPAGAYRVMLEGEDRFGKKISSRLPLTVLEPDAKKLALRVPNLVRAPKWDIEPGQEFSALWGSGYDKARAYIEVEHRRKVLQSFWTDPANTQQQVKQAVTEAMRGGFTVRVTMVRENRAYMATHHVNVPWSNKNLTVKWEHFVSKLEPNRKETFTALITGHDAKRAVAEMVATLYDESLDQYLPHNWMARFGFFRQDHSNLQAQFENVMKHLQHLQGNWPHKFKPIDIRYRQFPRDLVANMWGYEWYAEGGFGGGGRGNHLSDGAPVPTAPPGAAMPKEDAKSSVFAPELEGKNAAPQRDPNAPPAQEPPAGPDLSQVAARKNLNETAFFFPHIVSDQEGVVKLVFTMPEALTTWKFLGFAHDKDVRSGLLQDKVISAKDLMIQPNAPRFVREGDALEFTVKVSNQSEQAQRGNVRLTFADARTNKAVDTALGIENGDQAFDVPAKESRTYSWKIKVPDGIGTLVYKAVGATDKLSDGEEGYLPALSRRVLVTESLPLPIRGNQTKTFDFAKLRESQNSQTIQHQSVTVQMVSQPAWYAVMALPYLMEYPYDCSEQQFNRLYANALARHIATSDPKIRRIFDTWKGTPALDSPLEKNQDLKSVMLEETPWLRQAIKESQARRNVGILFDDNRLNDETGRLFQKLAEMQNPDGLWPWFPGGRSNEYISLYITTGFGRMRHLGVNVQPALAIKALNGLDAWIDRIHKDILRHSDPTKNHLSATIALYLYGRSFFLKDKPVADGHKAAVDYFVGQAQKYWLQLANRQSQAHIALALKRWGDKETPIGIMKSIKERSVSNEELGMFWRDLERSHWWYRAPIETQAMMIEAFAEVSEDGAAVEDCKVWLLKQKQTQDWKTTKATADAVYALLLRGENLLKSDALVEVTLGDMKIQPEKVEAGTGFYEQRFVKTEVKPVFGAITVKKTDEGVSWGAVHWQYLEDVSKITPHDVTPLKLTKTLWLRKFTKKGPVIEPVKGPIQVGDEVVVRVELRTDRDMEYVHLKDGRGSGTEPVNVLSRYRYQDGLGYYETTRDTASHFFIDYLPKGVYVFEYATRIVHKGQYPTGMAEIQCMYAPEFNSHSESLMLDVK